MCYSCFEIAGRPSLWNAKIARAVDLTDTIYSWHPTGGLLHIVLDDWNATDENIRSTEQYVAEEGPSWDADEPELMAATRELLTLLKEMSEEERLSALARYGGYTPIPEGGPAVVPPGSDPRVSVSMDELRAAGVLSFDFGTVFRVTQPPDHVGRED